MLLNCSVGEDLESPLDFKEIKPVHPKGNQSWIFIGRTDAEAPILWPPYVKSWLKRRPWCWERLKAGGEGDDGEWDGWMISLTQCTWVWARPASWWSAGKLGVLQSMGLQSQTQLSDWTELNWTESAKTKGFPAEGSFLQTAAYAKW